MRDVAVTFARDSVAEQSSTPTAGGLLLSFGHFVELAHVSSDKTRREVLRRIRTNDLTVAQVRRLVEELTQQGWSLREPAEEAAHNQGE